ncbi:unnamed protein product [Darwinula stevensoni]|uniref:Uncharacterized protein n=1 Tax=Darwinula stevensoni TaxID=69355 RepID=A0A7R8XD33_9CRUS|nr:unnamed protein product [Darwinula stevensoni]CAG0893114.1 unnamed protein product [Darwinula stevensoni]
MTQQKMQKKVGLFVTLPNMASVREVTEDEISGEVTADSDIDNNDMIPEIFDDEDKTHCSPLQVIDESDSDSNEGGKAIPKNQRTIMKGIPSLLWLALIGFTEYGYGEKLAFDSVTAVRSLGHLVNMISDLTLKYHQLASDITQLRLDNENLKFDNENLKLGIKDLKAHVTANDDELADDIARLKAEDEILRIQLQKQLQKSKSRDTEMKVQQSTMEERLEYLEAITLQITPRTCGTLGDLGVTRTGTYLVDPDGALIGDPPIRVFCDMQTDPVTTVILHDSMETTEIEHCDEPGCYSRIIKYDASLRQMAALIDQSEYCEQQIAYGCFSSALNSLDVQYAWWVDRHGDPQYYWDGSHAGEHICDCGVSDTCVDPDLPCNCDAEAPQWESDVGAIDNATALPIAEVRFGGLRFDGQRANHTLGGLACRGEAPMPDDPAESCSSLRNLGHVRSEIRFWTAKLRQEIRRKSIMEDLQLRGVRLGIPERRKLFRRLVQESVANPRGSQDTGHERLATYGDQTRCGRMRRKEGRKGLGDSSPLLIHGGGLGDSSPLLIHGGGLHRAEEVEVAVDVTWSGQRGGWERISHLMDAIAVKL